MGTNCVAAEALWPQAQASHTIALADGGSVRVVAHRAAEIRDGEGRLLVRYRDGALELSPERGDLVLRAPAGGVRIEAAAGVSLVAGRESELQLSDEATLLRATRLDVDARQARLVSAVVSLLARDVTTTAQHVAQTVERYELVATCLFERARDSLREVKELAEERVGRLRTIVDDVCTLDARRTYLRSEEDTSIDGRRVLLG